MSEKFPRVAIVTGATSGFGQATVRKFISAGFVVVGSGRNQFRLESMEKQSKAGDARNPNAPPHFLVFVDRNSGVRH